MRNAPHALESVIRGIGRRGGGGGSDVKGGRRSGVSGGGGEGRVKGVDSEGEHGDGSGDSGTLMALQVNKIWNGDARLLSLDPLLYL
jgi:hypothetical protein